MVELGDSQILQEPIVRDAVVLDEQQQELAQVAQVSEQLLGLLPDRVPAAIELRPNHVLKVSKESSFDLEC